MQETQSLYRKYRPKDFDEVVGQNHIVEPLLRAVESGKPAHAYLFVGTRGTGKTTVARIMAKRLGVGQSDLFEIDAASNRGIDDIRELRDGVTTYPIESPYKVYIIDEVHMLTKEAFNALLKTLEEPPSHALFILATTEVEKVPDTIVSRCEVYEFLKPSDKVLANHIIDIARREGAKLDPSAGDLIALLGNGSFRDAIGYLQKAMHLSEDRELTLSEIETVLGVPSLSIVYTLFEAIARGDAEQTEKAVSELFEKGVMSAVAIDLVLSRLRFVLLARLGGGVKAESLKGLSDVEKSRIDSVLKIDEGFKLNSALLVNLLESKRYAAVSAVESLPLELAILKSMN